MKLCAEITAQEKPRREKITSNERIFIELYKGNKRRVDIAFDGESVEVNWMTIELEE